MKKATKNLILITMAAVLLFAAAACGSRKENTSGDMPENEENISVANPFTDFASLAEAEEAAGFTIALPEVPEADRTVYRAAKGQMLEVIFCKGEEHLLTLRKAAGIKPVDGDFNSYEKEVIVQFNHMPEVSAAREKLSGGKVRNITWTLMEGSNTYSYAVLSNPGLEEKDAEEMLTKVIMKTLYKTEPTDPGSPALPSGQEVSPRTVLITVADDFTEEDLKDLLKKHSLTVKYDYSSMKIYALTADHDMNEKELAALLSALTEESKVLSAEPDQVIKLTDPIKPQLSTE